MVRIKRVYDPPSAADGTRILVDRLWPRGLSRPRAAVDAWLRDLAPSHALRTWFGHDPKRWPEFRRRYRAELSARRPAVAALTRQAARGTVTLLFGAKDTVRNNAVVLKAVVQGMRARRRTVRKAGRARSAGRRP